MTIHKNQEGTRLTYTLEGRLDTTTAPELDSQLKGSLQNITELIFDFSKLQYISSAGLRLLLAAQKTMNTQGSMVIKNANEIVMEVFEVTGFADILTIQNDSVSS